MNSMGKKIIYESDQLSEVIKLEIKGIVIFVLYLLSANYFVSQFTILSVILRRDGFQLLIMYPPLFSEVSKQEYEVSNERANDRANNRSLTSDLWRCGQLSMQHKRVRRSFQEGAGPFLGAEESQKVNS